MKKIFKQSLLILFLITIFLILNAYSYASSISNGLSEDIFRLHILANSDSTEDQALKLKVRDAILEYMKSLSTDFNNKQEVIKVSKTNSNEFEKIAEQVIKENGYSYPVEIEFGNFYFPTKKYGNISLPAGNYDAMRIKIGEAKGQNWWCSLFPPLCFISISSGIIDEKGEEYLKENLSEEEFAIISNSSSEIEFKFKILELINKKS